MSSHLSQFHYHASSIEDDIDFKEKSFNADSVHHYFYQKHSRPLLQGFFDNKMLAKIQSLSKTPQEYNDLYVKFKEFTNAASQKFESE